MNAEGREDLNWWWSVSILIVLTFATSAQGAERQVLRGHVPTAAANLSPAGRLPGTQRLKLAIGLPLRNRDTLSNLLAQIYDPQSPNYRHYLSATEFAEKFGPAREDYERVVAFAESHGLSVAARHPNRMLLDVEGSVTAIEQALHVRMQSYAHPREKRNFFAPDAEPSLDLTVPVLHISGLDNFALPHPANLVVSALDPGAEAAPNAGSGPGGTYLGNDFRAAYAPGVALNGAGQTVGLLQFDGYTASDITYYETQAGLPGVTLTNVLLDGFSGNPTESGGEVEVSLDIEMVISMAPGVSKVIVYEAGPSGNWHDILNRMATDNLAKQLSCSWYIPGGAADAVADQIFQQMAAQGQSFFNASGDFDAYTGPIDFPGDTPYITQVGGTMLTTTGGGGAWVSEAVWNRNDGIGSGAGISTYYSIPSWQAGVNMTANLGSTLQRNTPDVALTAESVYVRANGGSYNVGGTSCAAPLWAGFAALINQQAVVTGQPYIGFINPAVYAIGLGSGYTNVFHDITMGNNFRPGSGNHFPAVAGYDLCTGWGTPNGQAFINALVPPDALSISPASGFSANGAVGGPFDINAQTFKFTNTSPGSLTWSLSNTSTWLTASVAGGSLSAGGSTNVTVSLTSVASNLPQALYTADVAVSNYVSGFVHHLPFSLLVHDPLVILPTNGFNSHGPVGGPFTITSQNYTLSNSGPASLDWTLSNTPLWMNASTIAGTLPTGLVATVIVSLNSVASNPPPAFYTGNLVFSNVTGNLAQSRAVSLRTGEVPVQNGGFETGNFLGWLLSGNTTRTLVTSNALYVHSGVYGASLSPPGTLGFLAQSFSTVPGQAYLISFWLENLGAGQNEFLVNWSGSTVFDKVNMAATGWTNIQILVAALTTNTTLQFGFRNDNSTFGLDDVSLFQTTVPTNPPTLVTQPTNETVIAGMGAVMSVGASGIQPFLYQWQFMGTNVVGATNSSLTLLEVQPTNAGNYAVAVSNAFGGTTSSNALLTVIIPVCTPPPAGLVGWWEAESDASDSKGTNNGSQQGGVTFAAGKDGQAFNLDGSSGYVNIPASASLNVGAGAGLTIECWIKPSDVAKNHALVEWNSGSGLGSHFWISVIAPDGNGPGCLYANLIDTSGNRHSFTTAGNVVNTNVFQHVALTYDQASGVGVIYYNGTAVATQNLGSFTPQTSYGLQLGDRITDPNSFYRGLLDEVSLYSRALSSAEIAAIYSAEAAGKCQPQVAPSILTQPQNQAANVGDFVNFSVIAAGTHPLSYQWRFNGTNLSGASSSTLTLANVQLTQAGNYAVLVANAYAPPALSSNAVLTVNAVPACDPPPAGLVSWWAGENNVLDSVGTNNGTLQGGVTFAAGKVGKAFNLNGSSGYINIPASPSLDLGAGAGLTIECWINPADVANNHALVEWNNGAAYGTHFWMSVIAPDGNGPGCLYANVADTGGISHAFTTAASIITTNGFQHVALTYNKASGLGVIYFNGAAVATQSLGSFTPQTSYNLQLGKRITDPNSYYRGLLDEVSLYNRALSATEIAAIYNAQAAGKCQPQVAPSFLSQPQSEVANVGDVVSFNAFAVGSPVLGYQWRFNGTNLSGATSSSLTLTNVQLTQAGNYAVLVTNAYAPPALSTNAVLTVNAAPCTLSPSNIVGWWAGEGNALDSTGTNNGSLQGGVTFAAGKVGQAFNLNGSSAYVNIPSSASVNVGAAGGLTMECWIKPADVANNHALMEWNNGAGGGTHFWISVAAPSGNGPGCLYANLIDTGVNSHILTTPANLVNTNGFQHVAVTYDKTSGVGVLYYNGTAVVSQNLGSFAAQTSYNLQLGTRISDGNGFYRGLMDEVSLYSRALSAAEIAAIYAAGASGKCPVGPPVLTTQPQSQAVVLGSNVTFNVVATGAPPLAYRWKFNGTNLAGATGTSLTLTNVLPTNAGSYSVVVTNTSGSVSSSNALLTILFPPVITLQPLKQVVTPGCSVSFTSAASGTLPLAYQWQRNGLPLPGQTATNLAVSGVQAFNFGNYAMTASNAYGVATSSVAVLALDNLPVAGGTVVYRYLSGGIRIDVSTVLANDTDADNDPLSIIGVNSNSVTGGTVTLNGRSIFYTPPGGTNSSDAFNYTLSDGHCGGTTVGTVLVDVRNDSNPASTAVIERLADGSMRVIFDGMPGTAYRVQRTDSLLMPNWQDVATLAADQFGTYVFVDPPGTNAPTRYYRSVSP